MNALHVEIAARPTPAMPMHGHSPAAAKRHLLARLADCAERGNLNRALAVLTDYVGASHYLLARYDLSQDTGLDFVLCSDWPFDAVKAARADPQRASYEVERAGEMPVAAAARLPDLPDDVSLGHGLSRDYCAVTFCVGRERFSLMLLFPQDVILSRECLREIGLSPAISQASPARRSCGPIAIST